MADPVKVIQSTDKTFDLRVLKSTGDPKALTDANLVLALKLPSEDLISGQEYLEVTLTPNANGSSLTISNAEGGRITVVLGDVDTALLKVGNSQNMELLIQEGAGPDFDEAKVQFLGLLDVAECLFPEASP